MIQRNLFFCVVVIFCVCRVEISHCQTTIGTRALSTGQTGVALPNHKWAIFSNAALLPTDERYISFYGFRYVGISEITDLAASAIIPTRLGSFSTGFHRYGFDLFNRTDVRLGYKKQISKFHGGMSLSYSVVQQSGGYGSAGAVGLNIGIAGQILQNLWLAARATNVNQPSYGSSDEYLPRDLAIGISYLPAERMLLSMDFVKDVRFPLSLRAGTEFEVINGFFARTGITTQPKTYAGGFGYITDRWQINIGIQQHIPLGVSPAVDMGINF